MPKRSFPWPPAALVTQSCFTLALLAALASAAVASVRYPPGPPYRSCPDSATIFQIQQTDTVRNACAPANTDTVLGVRGIVIAFKRTGSGTIYIARSGDDPAYGGLQVFPITHLENANPYGPTLQLGDSIAVDGVVSSFLNETFLAGSLTSGSMKVRLVDRGHPVPVRPATTTTLKWTPTSGAQSAFVTADPLEGCLVRVQGPLRVARTEGGAGVTAGATWLCVNGDGSAPGDSVLVDGSRLPSIAVAPPTLGTSLDWVQGVLRRTAVSGVDLWCVSPRDANDVGLVTAPRLAEAYPIADDTLRLTFDRDVDAPSAETTSHYALLSAGSTVHHARVVGGAGPQVDLAVALARPRLSLDTLTAVGIGAAAAPESLSASQTASFVVGVLSCAEVQAPLPGVCPDRSRFAGAGDAMGPRLTVRGVAVADYPVSRWRVLADEEGGARSGVLAYNLPFDTPSGHEVLLACRVREADGRTELVDHVARIDRGASPVPPPVEAPVGVLTDLTCDPAHGADNAADYEGRLVRVRVVGVVPWNTPPAEPTPGGPFRVVQLPARTDTITVWNSDQLYTFAVSSGTELQVDGLLALATSGGRARIHPRGNSDITVVIRIDAPLPTTTRIHFSVGPNPGRTATVRFTLPAPSDVDLAVFDLSGRRIGTLARGVLAAGAHEYPWSGAGPGVYFVRLRVGEETHTLRAVHRD